LAKGRVERRLAAILAADVAGYSRLMGADEEGTHERLKAHLQQLVDPKIEEHRGRIAKNTGDGMLVEFGSVVEAVRCAAEIQLGMIDRNADTPEDKRITFRMGVNLGDVIIEPEDIFGDGVNITARLEALAEPGGICVTRVVRDQVRDKLDFSFEDMGEHQVKNIARPIRVHRVVLGEGPGSPEPATEPSMKLPLALPDKPSIAVLPFQNMSGDPEQEYFADGMVEEIITALSRIRWLFVIARNSSFAYKGQAIDVKRVGRELGVRYVLEGSVRKDGNRVRITAQLIDALSAAHLWADRFDGSLEDVFDLQDKVASNVAGVIEPALQAAEIRRSAGRPTKDLTAYDLYLRGYAMSLSSTRQMPEALRLLEQAIARDPRFGSALAWAAHCCYRLIVDGRSDDPVADRLKGADFARRALEVADDEPWYSGECRLCAGPFRRGGHRHHDGVGRPRLGAEPELRARLAHQRQSQGLRRPARHRDRAYRGLAALEPRARVGPSLAVIGRAHFFSRRFDAAVPKLLLAIQEDPSFPGPYRFLAACYAHMDRLDDAREVVTRLRAITSAVIPDVSFLRNAEQRELLMSGLHLAAGEAA